MYLLTFILFTAIGLFVSRNAFAGIAFGTVCLVVLSPLIWMYGVVDHAYECADSPTYSAERGC